MLSDILLYLSLLAPVVALPALLLMVRVEQWAAGTPVTPDSRRRTPGAAARLQPASDRRHAVPDDRAHVTTPAAVGPRG
jgi:hypothetical protein